MRWRSDSGGQGGPVLYGILLVCLLLWSLSLERLYYCYFELPKYALEVTENWQARNDKQSWTAQMIRSAWLSQHKQSAEKYLSTISILIAVCPLMGLLGTVTGMISVFDVLAITGTGNARAMANGISQATIPTMAGLVV